MAITENIGDYFVLRGRQAVLCGASMSTAPEGFINLQGGSTLATIPFAITQGITNGTDDFIVWSRNRNSDVRFVTHSEQYGYLLVTKDNKLYGLSYGETEAQKFPNTGVTNAQTDQIFFYGDEDFLRMIAEINTHGVGIMGFGDSLQTYPAANGGREVATIDALVSAGHNMKATPRYGPGANEGSGLSTTGDQYNYSLANIAGTTGASGQAYVTFESIRGGTGQWDVDSRAYLILEEDRNGFDPETSPSIASGIVESARGRKDLEYLILSGVTYAQGGDSLENYAATTGGPYTFVNSDNTAFAQNIENATIFTAQNSNIRVLPYFGDRPDLAALQSLPDQMTWDGFSAQDGTGAFNAHDRGISLVPTSNIGTSGAFTARYLMATFESADGSGITNLRVKRAGSSAEFGNLNYESVTGEDGWEFVDIDVDASASRVGFSIVACLSSNQQSGQKPNMSLGARFISRERDKGFIYDSVCAVAGKGGELWARQFRDADDAAIDLYLQEYREFSDRLMLHFGLSGHGFDDPQLALDPATGEEIPGLETKQENAVGEVRNIEYLINRIRNRCRATGYFDDNDIYIFFEARNPNFTADAGREAWTVELHNRVQDWVTRPGARHESLDWVRHAAFCNQRDLTTLEGFGDVSGNYDGTPPDAHLSQTGARLQADEMWDEITKLAKSSTENFKKPKFFGYDVKSITDQNDGNLFVLGERNRLYVVGVTYAGLPVRYVGSFDFGTQEQAEFILKRGGSMFTMTSRGLYRVPSAEGTFPEENSPEGTTIGVEFLGDSFRCIPNTQFWVGGEFVDDEANPFGTT